MGLMHLGGCVIQFNRSVHTVYMHPRKGANTMIRNRNANSRNTNSIPRKDDIGPVHEQVPCPKLQLGDNCTVRVSERSRGGQVASWRGGSYDLGLAAERRA